MKKLTGIVLVLTLLFTNTVLAKECGSDRWSIKIGTDREAGKINLTKVQDTTIQKLTSIPRPAKLDWKRRYVPVEFTVWRLRATLTLGKDEDDQDYHLVLKDDAGRTMIAEIPDPECVRDRGRFATRIKQARAQFENDIRLKLKDGPVKVEVEGVGFFDYRHGQTGLAPNAVELHPITNIKARD